MGKFLYQEIKDYLLGLIKEHKSEPRYQLPSVNQLALKFATTRITQNGLLPSFRKKVIFIVYMAKALLSIRKLLPIKN